MRERCNPGPILGAGQGLGWDGLWGWAVHRIGNFFFFASTNRTETVGSMRMRVHELPKEMILP